MLRDQITIHNFVPRKSIEADTLALIADYERKYGRSVTPPIPVEEILEAHLGLAYDFDDLPKLVNDPEALGGLWFRSREVKFDQSLDPTVFPSKLGRYRFTVAHETGHWELHRDMFLSSEGQAAMFEEEESPVICRSNMIESNGWNKIAAFQTRNPMHRAHEELVRICMDRVGCEGAVIHMLLGKLKKGDIPADVRDAAIRKMVELYFPANTCEITGYGFDMLYSGPREAVLHALFRQNMGCTHLIVGRDHAGVGDYYGAFEAQEIFHTDMVKGQLEIEIFEADHTAWSNVVGEVIMMREAPEGHKKEDFVFLSGTKVREMLAAGTALPPEFARPEVAEILMKHYQSADA